MARIRSEFERNGAVEVMAHCRLTICSILACICFGAKVSEHQVKQIEEVLKDVMMMTTPKLPDFLPVLTPLFRGRLRAARRLRQLQMDCLLPLVRARRAFVKSGGKINPGCPYEMVSPPGSAYVDSLFGLDPAGRGQLGEAEMVTLCSEVMSAGTDTSATTLEWALLHLVLDPTAQERLHSEIIEKVGAERGDRARKLTESDVEGMEYLTAVIKETLRRHPPSHFVLSHAAIEETELGGYRVPLGASLEIYTAWVVEDPNAWDKPKQWRPERFLKGGEGSEVDVTGGKGVKMVPFGAGRRICPAASVGILHVQLMLANMVREFLWVAPDGAAPSTEEAFAFTVVMKEPLKAAIEERK